MIDTNAPIIWTRAKPAGEVNVAIPTPPDGGALPGVLDGYELRESVELGAGFERGEYGWYERPLRQSEAPNPARWGSDLPRRLLRRRDRAWGPADLPFLQDAAETILLAHDLPSLKGSEPGEYAWRWDGKDLSWASLDPDARRRVPWPITTLERVTATPQGLALWPMDAPLRWAVVVGQLAQSVEAAREVVCAPHTPPPERAAWLDERDRAIMELVHFLRQEALRRRHGEFLASRERIHERQVRFGGSGQRKKAQKWKRPALKKAIEIRKAKPSYSQERVAEEIEAAAIPGLPDMGGIVSAIRDWEDAGLLPPSLFKAERQARAQEQVERPEFLPEKDTSRPAVRLGNG